MRRSPPDKPRLLAEALLRSWRLPEPKESGSKEHRGRVLIIAGAVEMPGAAILASTAALRAGAGKVRVATAEQAALGVATAVPELFVLSISDGDRRKASMRAIVESAEAADAVLIGSGMRDADAIRTLLPELLALDSLRGLLIDASALPLAIEFLCKRSRSSPVILTPHIGEMASINDVDVDDVKRDPLRTARETARRLGATIALKGAETFICAADGSAYINKRGNVGLATAGSGDVLAGILVGLCARGAEPLHAAASAVWLHARAGEQLAKRVGPIGYLAREILDEVPALMSRI